ncbi:MAG TPA: choice-of-anchor R domain-containing protein [Rhizomicrobium sp.]|nr:choice-of-anchor R domain-containing protein [Rhizomicrobium sp.]
MTPTLMAVAASLAISVAGAAAKDVSPGVGPAAQAFQAGRPVVPLQHGSMAADLKLPSISGCPPNRYPMCNWGLRLAPWWPWWGGLQIIGEGGSYDDGVALSFTPTKTSKADQISVGLGYVSGTNGVSIGLYTDAGGVPGGAIESQDVYDLPAFGTCCTYTTIKFPTVKLSAGTKYWIVLGTDANTSNANVVWYGNTSDVIDSAEMAYNQGGGWVSYNAPGAPNYNLLTLK